MVKGVLSRPFTFIFGRGDHLISHKHWVNSTMNAILNAIYDNEISRLFIYVSATVYFDWQYDNETTNGQDGYAGSFGINLDKLQLILTK